MEDEDLEDEDLEDEDCQFVYWHNGLSYWFKEEQEMFLSLDKLTIGECRTVYKETREVSEVCGDLISFYLMKRDPESDYNCAKKNGTILLQPDGTKCYDEWKFEDLLKGESVVRLVDEKTAEDKQRDYPVLLIDRAYRLGYYMYWLEQLPNHHVVLV